jgi:hypothetical protein
MMQAIASKKISVSGCVAFAKAWNKLERTRLADCQDGRFLTTFGHRERWRKCSRAPIAWRNCWQKRQSSSTAQIQKVSRSSIEAESSQKEDLESAGSSQRPMRTPQNLKAAFGPWPKLKWQIAAMWGSGAILGPLLDGRHSHHNVLHYADPTVCQLLDCTMFCFRSLPTYHDPCLLQPLEKEMEDVRTQSERRLVVMPALCCRPT